MNFSIHFILVYDLLLYTYLILSIIGLLRGTLAHFFVLVNFLFTQLNMIGLVHVIWYSYFLA